jgi:glutaredoxin
MVELFVFTQPGCPHCQAVKAEMDFIFANYPNVTHINLDRKSASYNEDIQLFQSFGAEGTPSGVIVENGKPTLYGGQENFKNNYLANQYQQAIDRNNISSTQNSKPGVNPDNEHIIIVDPPPAHKQTSINKKWLGLAVGVALIYVLTK